MARASSLNILAEGASFAVVGAVCFVVDAEVTLSLIRLGMGPYLGRAVAFSCAATASWYLNRTFTFRRRHRRSAPRLRELVGFVVANLPGAAVNYLVYSILIGFGLAGALAAVAIGSLSGMLCNFTASRTLIFRPPAPPPNR